MFTMRITCMREGSTIKLVVDNNNTYINIYIHVCMCFTFAGQSSVMKEKEKKGFLIAGQKRKLIVC